MSSTLFLGIFLIFLLVIAQFDAFHLEEALMDQQQSPYQRQIRSLANGRWQLRPGKRSPSPSSFYELYGPAGLGAREMRRPVGMGYVLSELKAD